MKYDNKGNRIFNISEIDNRINSIKKKAKQCSDRKTVHETIGEIHDIRYELEDAQIANAIPFHDYQVRSKQLKNAEGKVCDCGSAILSKLIEERDKKRGY